MWYHNTMSENKPKTNEQPQPTDSISIPKNAAILAAITSIVILAIAGGIGYRVGKSSCHDKGEETCSIEDIGLMNTAEETKTKPSPQLTLTRQQLEQPTQVGETDPGGAAPVIPPEWETVTQSDQDFGVTTSISIPQGYDFWFSGSEWTLQTAQEGEYWDYTPSATRIDGERVNLYDGGSRRQWYQRFINGELTQDTYIPPRQTILGTTEIDIGTTSYLRMSVQRTEPLRPVENHYIYFQNGLVHVFSPASEVASGPNATLDQDIGAILSSLQSNFQP